MTDIPSESGLREWIAECVGTLRARADFEVKREVANDFLLLFGLCARTIRYGAAYLELLTHDLSEEAIPIARSALEHALTAQWVYLLGDGIDKFRVEIAHNHKEHYGNLADWLKNAELAEELEKLGELPAGRRMPKFVSLLRELDDTDKFLETSYHMLSQQVHVTHSAVFSFLDWTDDEYRVNYERKNPYQYQTTYVVAIACMLVSWVIAKLTDDAEMLEHLNAKSDELVLPVSLEEHVLPTRRRSNGSSDDDEPAS